MVHIEQSADLKYAHRYESKEDKCMHHKEKLIDFESVLAENPVFQVNYLVDL
jgi:hypothetical protein